MPNTHKNPPEFWGMDDEYAVRVGLAPLCPISYNPSCTDCVYRHECPQSEYPGKDPNKTFVLVENNGTHHWKEVTKDASE
jgi:hypothetical protein